jgi:CheY-like chemotaxis protein
MKILIVEDDPGLREYLKDTMKAEGHQTQVAENGLHGLESYKKFEPDLVISDIQMPGMNGLELLESIRNSNTETIVVMITAYGSEEYAMQALHLGANNYFKKPVRHAELLPLLRKYDRLVKNRAIVQPILDMIVRQELTIQFENRVELLPGIIEHLVLVTGNTLSKVDGLGVRLGLFELLTNAVEHGNLEITYEEKTNALKSRALTALYAERLSDPVLAARKVTVEFTLEPAMCEWVISDEGKGFDWRQALRNISNTSALLEEHGRGILIAQHQFDHLEYLDVGSVVRVRKLARRNDHLTT